MGKIIAVGVLALFLVSGAYIGWYAIVTVPNEVVKLENRFKAQNQVVEEFYGKMFAILHQKAGVANEYKESFKEIYVPLIEGRYSNDGGALMKWIQEHNPQFDASLFKDIMVSIEAERNGFFIEQKKMTDLVLQHDNLRTVKPKAWFVNTEPLVYEPIQPAAAKKVIESREETDSDLNLF